jgi:hypothetical protein
MRKLERREVRKAAPRKATRSWPPAEVKDWALGLREVDTGTGVARGGWYGGSWEAVRSSSSEVILVSKYIWFTDPGDSVVSA